MRNLLLALLLVSCSKHHCEVGRYVYVDSYKTIHIDRECVSKLTEDAKTKDERMASMEGISFVDTCMLTLKSQEGSIVTEYGFCPKCIDDDSFQHLNTMMHRNDETISKIDEIYDVLKDDGAIHKDREFFRSYMLASGRKGYENRKKLYDAMKADGADVGEDYEEFIEWLGIKETCPL